MSHSPERIFQARALEIGLKAKGRAVSLRDRLDLAVCALRCGSHAGGRYGTAALDFFDAVDRDQVAAGVALLDFLSDILPPDAVQPEFDWQRRADLQ